MTKIVSVTSHSIRSALAAARRELGLKYEPQTREVLRSGGEDGLYRVYLANGVVVECNIRQRSTTVVHSTELLDPTSHPT